MKKRIVSLALCTIMTAGLMGGCSGGGNAPAAGPANTGDHAAGAAAGGAASVLSGDLVFAIWDNNVMALIDETDMVARFQEKYPNINVEVEKLKDDTEYWNSMKMRASANQLPDVMFNKPFTLSRFQNYLLDLSDLQAVQYNDLVDGYRIDGKVLGIPATAGYEYVYYWKDMFAEAGVEVPTTWEQFKEVSATLQEYYGKDNPDFMAIAIGGKDDWTTYPYVEFMPALEGGNGQNWNDMAKQDEPFANGTDINKTYQKIDDLFSSGVFGKDPLGIGNDQATTLFAQKNAAIMALGDWGLQNIQNGTDDYTQLGTFYMPARDTEDDPYRVIVQGDGFIGVTNHSKNPEAAKAFVEWYLGEDWYPMYLNYVSSSPAMNNFSKEKDPILAEADSVFPDIEWVMYDGGGDDFQAIQNETTFDYKKLGAEMFISGFDLDARFAELNGKWTAARAKLGIQ